MSRSRRTRNALARSRRICFLKFALFCFFLSCTPSSGDPQACELCESHQFHLHRVSIFAHLLGEAAGQHFVTPSKVHRPAPRNLREISLHFTEIFLSPHRWQTSASPNHVISFAEFPISIFQDKKAQVNCRMYLSEMYTEKLVGFALLLRQQKQNTFLGKTKVITFVKF